MSIPTEPIGSIPRPRALLDAIAAHSNGTDPSLDPALDPLYDAAIRDTIRRFEDTGSPVITDGEQRKYHNFWTYAVQGLPNTAQGAVGFPIELNGTLTFQPDVALLDIGLPRLNGYDAACRIRELEGGEEIVLVALTGWGQEDDRRRCREAGFDHHMTKPVDFNVLENLLAQTSRRRR